MDLARRLQIAEQELGKIDPDGFCTCPGSAKHTGRNGHKDCQFKADATATVFCLHTNCAAEIEAKNAIIRRRILEEEKGADRSPVRDLIGEGVAAPPVAPRKPKYPPYVQTCLESFASRCSRPVSLDWLAKRSPVPVPPEAMQGQETSLLFLNHLYQSGERVLVLSDYYSQGNFMWEAGGESVRLSDSREVPPVPSALPAAGAEGVWFLTNPVTGEFMIQPATPGGGAKWGRRHGDCITSWRFLLLESDTAPEELWLKVLCLLPLPIAAVFTSGGRSVHALVKVDAASKLEIDKIRDVLRQTLGPLGADCAALSAVRLARLPGCLRLGKRDEAGKYHRHPKPPLQRLVWLNPATDGTPIMDIAK